MVNSHAQASNSLFCTHMNKQAAELEIEAYPLLDELTSKISTLNLERVRRLKSRLVALTRRVQKVLFFLIPSSFLPIYCDQMVSEI